MIESRGLMISFPSALRALHGGVGDVNEALIRNRNAPAGVRLPSPVDTRASVHGGLLAPESRCPAQSRTTSRCACAS